VKLLQFARSGIGNLNALFMRNAAVSFVAVEVTISSPMLPILQNIGVLCCCLDLHLYAIVKNYRMEESGP
jgi:hypothetical protein